MAIAAKKKPVMIKKKRSTNMNNGLDIKNISSEQMLFFTLQEIKSSINKLDQSVNSRIDKLDENVNSRIDKLDNRIDKLDDKIDSNSKELNDKIDSNSKELNDKIDSNSKELNDKIDRNFLWTLGVMITSLSIMIGGFIGLVAVILSKH